MALSTNTDKLTAFIKRHPKLMVITGAGCSAASGIPTYRSAKGEWLRNTPIQHQEFLNDEYSRKKYWSRSFYGWPRIENAKPNDAHLALERLETLGYCQSLVTQNVDGLHQAAGQGQVTDLHGRLDSVICQTCHQVTKRSSYQNQLSAANPELESFLKFNNGSAVDLTLPDGDTNIAAQIADRFTVPDCEQCGGILKPNVVFYGGSVNKALVAKIYDQLTKLDGILVVGSSLMVFSSFRFCRRAAQLNLPIAAINQGTTRADDFLSLKINAACEHLLPDCVNILM